MWELSSDARWHALYVRSRQEKSVQAQLDAKAHEVFLPLYCARHRWADRWKTVSSPLFPGYVFCRFNNKNRASVLATSGIIDVVRTGSQPASVDPGEIEALRRVVDSQLVAEPYAHLIKGETVTINEGPLKSLTGVLIQVRKGLRLVVSIELLRRSVLVEIDRDWVVPRKFSIPPYADSSIQAPLRTCLRF